MQADRCRLVPRVAVGALASPLEVGADRASRAAGDLAGALTLAGGDVENLGVLDTPDRATAAGRRAAERHVDAVAFAAASWFEDYLVLDFLEECGAPLLLWPLPGMETGALCGTQQLTAYLRRLGAASACVFGAADDSRCRAEAVAFLRAAALRSRLRRARIGMAGHHVNGMTHTAPDEVMLKKTLGPRVVWIDLPELLRCAAEVPDDAAHARWAAVVKRAGRCEVADTAGLDSMRLHAALRDTVQRMGLAAITIGCYPHLMGRVCLAASLLADEGVPMACEGDVHGAVGQYLLQLLTGQPTHNTDWLDPVDDHSVVFSHCGSGSFSLAANPADVRIASVRLMGQGACALFPAKPGPVTLVNLTTHADGYQCGMLEGEALKAEMVFPGNPVRVRFAQPVQRLLAWIHDTGLGHHWMIGGGYVGTEVRNWARVVGKGLTLSEP